MSTARNYTIENFFKQFYFTAPEVSWNEFDGSARVPTLIMKHIGAPSGSYLPVVKVPDGSLLRKTEPRSATEKRISATSLPATSC
jgi:hypothetical protein